MTVRATLTLVLSFVAGSSGLLATSACGTKRVPAQAPDCPSLDGAPLARWVERAELIFFGRVHTITDRGALDVVLSEAPIAGPSLSVGATVTVSLDGWSQNLVPGRDDGLLGRPALVFAVTSSNGEARVEVPDRGGRPSLGAVVADAGGRLTWGLQHSGGSCVTRSFTLDEARRAIEDVLTGASASAVDVDTIWF